MGRRSAHDASSLSRPFPVPRGLPATRAASERSRLGLGPEDPCSVLPHRAVLPAYRPHPARPTLHQLLPHIELSGTEPSGIHVAHSESAPQARGWETVDS